MSQQPTWTMRPTALKSVRTVSASSSLAWPPKHMALAVSPTRQGVLGITRTMRTSSPAASCVTSLTHQMTIFRAEKMFLRHVQK